MQKPRAVLLLVHGLGAHRERWGFLTTYCTKRNILSYAADIPAEKPLHTWFDYIQQLHKEIQHKHPNIPIYLCGESLGGLMSYRYIQKFIKTGTTKGSSMAGLILLSPAFKSKLQFTLLEYIGIVIGSVLPIIHVKAHFTAAMCTSDTTYQNKMRHNKKETRNFPTRLYLAIVLEQLKAIFGKIPTLPMLFLLAGNDVMVDTTTSKQIFMRLSSPHKRCITYKHMRHALSIEKKRNVVFNDIVTWIQGA